MTNCIFFDDSLNIPVFGKLGYFRPQAKKPKGKSDFIEWLDDEVATKGLFRHLHLFLKAAIHPLSIGCHELLIVTEALSLPDLLRGLINPRDHYRLRATKQMVAEATAREHADRIEYESRDRRIVPPDN